MNAEIKKQWIEALKSGDYQQGKSVLRQNTTNGVYHCCLGVLCELHAKATNTKWTADNRYCHQEFILPREVMAWSHLPEANPEVGIEAGLSLADCNDKGVSFTKIADIIEEKL
jgi:hypothetical protein